MNKENQGAAAPQTARVKAYTCHSNCSHGGVCVLAEGHSGKHDSDYCQWGDEEAISQEAADQLCRDNGCPQELLDLEAALSGRQT